MGASFVKVKGSLGQLQRMLREFRSYTHVHVSKVHSELEELNRLLTPAQLSKFCAIIDKESVGKHASSGAWEDKLSELLSESSGMMYDDPISPGWSSPTGSSAFSDDLSLNMMNI